MKRRVFHDHRKSAWIKREHIGKFQTRLFFIVDNLIWHWATHICVREAQNGSWGQTDPP